MSNASSLWNFALAVYDRPGIAALCLELQDEHGFDVTMLLSCLWHGQQYGIMDEALLDLMLEFSRPWQEQVVAPLRQTRRWLKQQRPAAAGDESVDILREQIKACELAAERQQLERLETMIHAAFAETSANNAVVGEPGTGDKTEETSEQTTEKTPRGVAGKAGKMVEKVAGTSVEKVAEKMPGNETERPGEAVNANLDLLLQRMSAESARSRADQAAARIVLAKLATRSCQDNQA